MKLLTRYVLREFCVPLFYCLTGFVSIYLLFELFGSFSRLSAARPGWGKACAYLAGYLAPYVMWMAPACLMLATLFFLKLVLKGAVAETSSAAIFRKFAQSVNDAALAGALNRMAKGMLADGTVDPAETAQLTVLLAGMEGQEAFRQALASARAAGVLTLEESAGLERLVRGLAKGGR